MRMMRVLSVVLAGVGIWLSGISIGYSLARWQDSEYRMREKIREHLEIELAKRLQWEKEKASEKSERKNDAIDK